MEARAVKDIDRFEMILQAYEYEKCKWNIILLIARGGETVE